MSEQNQRRQRPTQITSTGYRVRMIVAELRDADGQRVVKVLDGRLVQLEPLRGIQLLVHVGLSAVEIAQIVESRGVAGMVGADNVAVQFQGSGVVGPGIVKLTQRLVHQANVVVRAGRGGMRISEQFLAGVEELAGRLQGLVVGRVTVMRSDVRLHFQDSLLGLLGEGVVVVFVSGLIILVTAGVVGWWRWRRSRRLSNLDLLRENSRSRTIGPNMLQRFCYVRYE